MALVEKKCTYCGHYYLHDDGVDDKAAIGVGDKSLVEKTRRKIRARCPVCVDPFAVPKETIRKTTILTSMRRVLKTYGIDTKPLSKWEDYLPYLDMFPKAKEVYESNGTYRTVTFGTGTKFQGMYGEFEFGAPFVKWGRMWRKIRCCRCGRITKHRYRRIIEFACHYKQKQCTHCDRNSSQNLIPGGKKRDNSERAICIALNISLNDYRRKYKGNKLPKPVPALPEGTIVNGLKIIEAFWSEERCYYAPMYRLLCEKCNTVFLCQQKRVNKIYHRCSK